MSISSADNLHPTDGARFLLQLKSAESSSARYGASIFTPSHRFDYELHLRADGTAELRATDTAADAELEKRLHNLATSVARQAGAKNNPVPTWPARILRWRGPGRG